MRAFALPAAVILSLCLYMPMPALEKKLPGMLKKLHSGVQTVLQNKQIDVRHAFPVTAALLVIVSALLSLVHPLLCATIAAPRGAGDGRLRENIEALAHAITAATPVAQQRGGVAAAHGVVGAIDRFLSGKVTVEHGASSGFQATQQDAQRRKRQDHKADQGPARQRDTQQGKVAEQV